jgi:uncharacterized protein (TIGR03437 family)
VDGFLAKYDANLSPSLLTYFGGSGDDLIQAVAADASGNMYVTGQTSGASLPVRPVAGAAADNGFPLRAALQNTPGGGADAFVAKFDSTGKVVYSTFLGGSGDDVGLAMKADAAGNAYVAGRTSSPNFPRQAALMNALSARTDAFISKINPAGTALVFSTYFGGNGDDAARAMALDAAGNIFVAGDAGSSNLPIVNAAQGLHGGNYDAFVIKLDPNGSQLMYSTYLGGSGSEQGSAIAVDGATQEVLVAGYTQSTNFPTTTGAYRTTYAGAPCDVFITRLTAQTTTTPRLAMGGIAHAASYATGVIAPAQIVALFGFNMGPAVGVGLRLNSEGMVDTTLGETRVYFDGVAGPLVYVSAGQVNVVPPFAINGVTLVEVEYKGVKSGVTPIAVVPTNPGIISLNSTGSGQGAILNQDYSINAAGNAAGRGTMVMVYALGGGQTDPAGVDGKVNAGVYPTPRAKATATIGGKPADVKWIGGGPGFVAGVLQINIQVPDDVPTGGAVPIVVRIGERDSQAGVTMAVN